MSRYQRLQWVDLVQDETPMNALDRERHCDEHWTARPTRVEYGVAVAAVADDDNMHAVES